ncbi:unnamed protein product [Hydatigera taeniaeformis]|uniref:Fibronectin type-III domain-containing protein n=1 Tax=Hydatigena taeniaeformis TaxID=6205 RepID=A0A0R3XD07_HYDTA|nr:unnamed protein product [Hydatigera taeniaeformis]
MVSSGRSTPRCSHLSTSRHGIVIDPELTLPQHVQLHAVDPYGVNMTWQLPAKHYNPLTGYTIEWMLEDYWQERLLPPSRLFYTSSRLTPGQSISAAVRAHNLPNTSMIFDYIGERSTHITATTPTR